MASRLIFPLAFVGLVAAAALGMAGQSGSKAIDALKLPTSSPKRADKVVLTAAQWHKRLDAEAFDILRDNGTERAFSGKYAESTDKGTYICAGCGLPLFTSTTKFDSGTGWPSFYKPIGNNVWLKHDTSLGMDRVEVRCSRCDGHLGHLFDDAPQTPTGLRFCMNSAALTLKKG